MNFVCTMIASSVLPEQQPGTASHSRRRPGSFLFDKNNKKEPTDFVGSFFYHATYPPVLLPLSGKEGRAIKNKKPLPFLREGVGDRLPLHLIQTLVSIMIRFVRTVLFNTEICGLVISECGEFCDNFFEMESCDFFVKMFWKCIDTNFVVVFPKLKLCECLICKAIAHDKTWVASRTAEIHEAS